ncbi:MAG: hypothetical protein JSU01_11480 [Bacteroidetes bacterium]|nr:hypothetical protein [Bacteroidota bacterium]
MTVTEHTVGNGGYGINNPFVVYPHAAASNLKRYRKRLRLWSACKVMNYAITDYRLTPGFRLQRNCTE